MTNRSFGQIGLPPPTSWNLVDGDRVVGWTADNTVGFRGFGNQTEAVPGSYKRYLDKGFREALEIEGTPLRLEFRTGENPYKNKRAQLTPRQVAKRRRLMHHVKKRG